MAFLIHVFNTIPIEIEAVDPREVLEAITESNYHTLCAQYGLDPALIDVTRSSLQVQVAQGKAVPYFTVAYGRSDARPIVVHFQGREGISERLQPVPESAPAALGAAVQLVSIELDEAQLQDLGLLLGYELARWAAVQGQGIMLGLDGRWYRLNAYKAFLPLATPG